MNYTTCNYDYKIYEIIYNIYNNKIENFREDEKYNNINFDEYKEKLIEKLINKYHKQEDLRIKDINKAEDFDLKKCVFYYYEPEEIINDNDDDGDYVITDNIYDYDYDIEEEYEQHINDIENLESLLSSIFRKRCHIRHLPHKILCNLIEIFQE